MDRIGKFMVAGFVTLPPCLFAQGPYLGHSTFREWLNLVPEVRAAEVCGMTAAAHRLWAQNQLRVPESTFMIGDFSGSEQKDWIVQVHRPESKRPCDYILILRHGESGWKRMFLYSVPAEGESWTPRWFSKKRAIAIDTGRHRKRTGAATMGWSEGGGGKQGTASGFVVEDASVSVWIEWSEKSRRYVVKKNQRPEWWEIEQQ